jgi:hypothetical protein
MKATVHTFLKLVCSSIGLIACQQKPQPCTFAHQIDVTSDCYAGQGLELTASDYGGSPDGFEWNVIALKDTSESWGWTPNDKKLAIQGPDKFVIPDSLVSASQGLIVKVITNCQGQQKHSMYYALTKSQSATGNCIVWQKRS